MDRVEYVVVGAGVVGLAITRALARAGREVLVLDAGAGLGAGTSGRGSGVIHAGLYYVPGSLKAELCVAGRRALYGFAEDHHVPHRRIGKLVVASDAAECEALAWLAERARTNGVDDVEMLDAAAARRLEPALACHGALLSPSTGVVDAVALLQALRDDAESFGAVSAFSAPVGEVGRGRAGFELAIGGATPMRIACRSLVNAAGHGAPPLATRIEGLDAAHVPQPAFAKGTYFTLDRPAPFSRLIYPLPVPGGVGTHLTIDVAGTARFGPDVEWVEGLDCAVDPGREAGFAADIRRYWPGLPDGALTPSHAGIRPKIVRAGEPAADFVVAGETVHGVPGLINLFGIESPGLTAALALGDYVAAMI